MSHGSSNRTPQPRWKYSPVCKKIFQLNFCQLVILLGDCRNEAVKPGCGKVLYMAMQEITQVASWKGDIVKHRVCFDVSTNDVS